jgi:hypothetical protein
MELSLANCQTAIKFRNITIFVGLQGILHGQYVAIPHTPSRPSALLVKHRDEFTFHVYSLRSPNSTYSAPVTH